LPELNVRFAPKATSCSAAAEWRDGPNTWHRESSLSVG